MAFESDRTGFPCCGNFGSAPQAPRSYTKDAERGKPKIQAAGAGSKKDLQLDDLGLKKASTQPTITSGKAGKSMPF